jgi:hypothetical protein
VKINYFLFSTKIDLIVYNINIKTLGGIIVATNTQKNNITEEDMKEIQQALIEWQFENIERELEEHEDYLEDYSKRPKSKKKRYSEDGERYIQQNSI